MHVSMADARCATLVLALVAACGPAQAKAPRSNWSIAPAGTHVRFTIDAMGWPRTAGKFERFEGKIAIDFENPSRSRVQFRVQSGSANTGSSGFNDFVRGPALLNAAAFPSIDFTSTSVVKTSDHSVRVSGDLTLVGVTHPLDVYVDVDRKGEGALTRLGFVAKTKIDRLDFGMNSGYPVISRYVFLTISTDSLER